MLGFNYEKLIRTEPRNNLNIFATHQRIAEFIDGDTIRLETGLPIRLIGLNAPDKSEPLHNEARAFLIDTVGAKIVDIEYDRVQNDNYGRLRGYAFINCDSGIYCRAGRLNVNIALVGSGFAKTQFGKLWLKPKYHKELLEAEKQAKIARKNLWGIKRSDL